MITFLLGNYWFLIIFDIFYVPIELGDRPRNFKQCRQHTHTQAMIFSFTMSMKINELRRKSKLQVPVRRCGYCFSLELGFLISIFLSGIGVLVLQFVDLVIKYYSFFFGR